jgi:hypothetical protein
MQARTAVPLRFSGERKGPATVREKEEPNTNDMPRDVGAQETDAKLGTVIATWRVLGDTNLNIFIAES